MIRMISILAGLFFTVALGWALILGGMGVMHDGIPTSVEKQFHKHPKELSLASDGAFGKFDRAQLQRGFQVYKEVCSNCHAMKYVAFRDLTALGYNEDEVKAVAKGYKVPAFNPATGEAKSHDGTPADHFPPVVYAGQGNPPDLSLAYIFGDITSVTSPGTAALLAFINQSLGQPLPTVAEIKADLQETSAELAQDETPLP